MRIISKTQDYYDSALAYGYDENLIFLRAQVDGPNNVAELVHAILEDAGVYVGNRLGATIPSSATYSISKYRRDPGMLFATVKPIVVGFCGVLHPAIMYQYELLTTLPHTEIYYITRNNADEIGKKLEASIHKQTPVFADEHLSYPRWQKQRKTTYLQNLVNNAALLAGSTRLENVFVDNKVPYFVVDLYEGTTTFLPILKDYQFVKVKDPFTAMQELSMYVGGVIPQQEKEIINISDKDRIAQHGFDKKSFRHPFK